MECSLVCAGWQRGRRRLSSRSWRDRIVCRACAPRPRSVRRTDARTRSPAPIDSPMLFRAGSCSAMPRMLSITCVIGVFCPASPLPRAVARALPPKPVTWWMRMLSIFSAGFIIWAMISGSRSSRYCSSCMRHQLARCASSRPSISARVPSDCGEQANALAPRRASSSPRPRPALISSTAVSLSRLRASRPRRAPARA